jgi:hypothetical protein
VGFDTGSRARRFSCHDSSSSVPSSRMLRCR